MKAPHSTKPLPKTKKGFFVAGVDEAGRGPWAGPLIAAAVILKPQQKLPGLNDSKKLSSLKRERFYEKITKSCISYAVGEVSNDFIDQYGLTKACQEVNILALKQLRPQPNYVLFDGRDKQTTKIPHKTIIKGDTFVREIMAASIIAKVTRDRKMLEFARKYPAYQFEKHKGYGTRLHQALLNRHKPCAIHRKSYTPINENNNHRQLRRKQPRG